MTTLFTQSQATRPCRAQEPKNCRYHGALIKADEAAARGDATNFLKYKLEADAIETLPETRTAAWINTPEPSRRARAVNAAGSLAVPAQSRYTPTPGRDASVGINRNYTGGKYDGRFRDVADIAKDIRADIKAAQAGGYLPKTLKYAVTIDKYSMGQAVHVSIQGAKNNEIYVPTREQARGRGLTEQANLVENRVEAIVKQYHRDDSQPQTDSYNTNFNYRVRIEDETEAAGRVAETQRKARMREAATYRKNLLNEIREAGSSRTYFESQIEQFTNTTADNSATFTMLDSPSPVLVMRSVRVGGNPRYSVYDLAGSNAGHLSGQEVANQAKTLSAPHFERLYKRFRVNLNPVG